MTRRREHGEQRAEIEDDLKIGGGQGARKSGIGMLYRSYHYRWDICWLF